eukprot:147007-Prymnesium_polylepis.1
MDKGAHLLISTTAINIERAMAKLHKLWGSVCKCLLALCMFRTKVITVLLFSTTVTPPGAPGWMPEALVEF